MNALIYKAGWRARYGSLAIIAALLMVACGGGRHDRQAALPLEQAPTGITAPATPQTPATLAEALAQLDALAMPEGIAPEVWDELKGKLRSGLNDRFGGKGAAKIVSGAPNGMENVIKWICGVKPDADTPGRLMWRYQNSGDYNLDGVVGANDLTPLAVAYGKSVSEYPDCERIDTSGNGKVDIADLTSVASHFGSAVSNYKVYMQVQAGQWKEVASIPFIASEVSGGWRTYDIACESWETEEPVLYLVCPFAPDGLSGIASLSANAYSLNLALGNRLVHAPFDVAIAPSYWPPSFVRWEFPPEVRNGPASEAAVSLTLHETGEYSFFVLTSYDGKPVRRRDFKVTIVPPYEIPIDCRKLATPEGPMLYWSREVYLELPNITLTILRGGQPLAELPGSNWYYLDDSCGLEEHAYKLKAHYRGYKVTESATFLAGGAVAENEHLYLLMEPANYAGVSSEILGLVVNTKHPMWMVPSFKIGTHGIAAPSLAPRFLLPDHFAAKTVTELETPYRLPLMHSFDFTAEYSFRLTDYSRFDWEEKGGDAPETIPAGSTVMLGPVTSSISRSGVPGARIAPTSSGNGHLLFYIDAYRNMYRFEYIHNFRLDNYAIGSGIPTEPFSGVMPAGKPPLYGDLDGNGIVNIVDTTALAMNWNSEVNEYNYSVDQNYDGWITILDFLYVLFYFGDTLP